MGEAAFVEGTLLSSELISDRFCQKLFQGFFSGPAPKSARQSDRACELTPAGYRRILLVAAASSGELLAGDGHRKATDAKPRDEIVVDISPHGSEWTDHSFYRNPAL